jgi:hypothetical protein
MENRKVWDVLRKEVVPAKRRCIKSKCILKIKRNEVLEQYWFYVDIVRFLLWILMRVMNQLSTT